MSVEWYKFRLREGVDAAAMEELVRQQSAGFRAAVNLPQDGEGINELERNEAIQLYLRSTKALLPYLSFVGKAISPVQHEVDRSNIAYIAFNDIFPHEWREEAKSSILPRDLPALLEKWQSYAQDLRMGYYEDYLCRLFLYEDYNPHFNGYPSWAGLLKSFHEKVKEAPLRREDWAQTRALANTLEEINADPVLPFALEAPAFGPEARERDMQPETRAAFDEYKAETERLMHQILAWNRCVPESEKLRIPTFTPVQVRMRQRVMASREWLHPFFEWCETAVDEGCGLFLAG